MANAPEHQNQRRTVTAFLLGALVGTILSLIGSTIFFKLVEEPSQRELQEFAQELNAPRLMFEEIEAGIRFGGSGAIGSVITLTNSGRVTALDLIIVAEVGGVSQPLENLSIQERETVFPSGITIGPNTKVDSVSTPSEIIDVDLPFPFNFIEPEVITGEPNRGPLVRIQIPELRAGGAVQFTVWTELNGDRGVLSGTDITSARPDLQAVASCTACLEVAKVSFPPEDEVDPNLILISTVGP